jgi:hypothetical protein
VSLPPTLEQARARAAAHERELSEHTLLSVAEVSEIIKMSQTYVRDIPRDELPFGEFGHGHKLKRRRYRRVDVDAYVESLFAQGKRRARE